MIAHFGKFCAFWCNSLLSFRTTPASHVSTSANWGSYKPLNASLKWVFGSNQKRSRRFSWTCTRSAAISQKMMGITQWRYRKYSSRRNRSRKGLIPSCFASNLPARSFRWFITWKLMPERFSRPRPSKPLWRSSKSWRSSTNKILNQSSTKVPLVRSRYSRTNSRNSLQKKRSSFTNLNTGSLPSSQWFKNAP